MDANSFFIAKYHFCLYSDGIAFFHDDKLANWMSPNTTQLAIAVSKYRHLGGTLKCLKWFLQSRDTVECTQWVFPLIITSILIINILLPSSIPFDVFCSNAVADGSTRFFFWLCHAYYMNSQLPDWKFNVMDVSRMSSGTMLDSPKVTSLDTALLQEAAVNIWIGSPQSMPKNIPTSAVAKKTYILRSVTG